MSGYMLTDCIAVNEHLKCVVDTGQSAWAGDAMNISLLFAGWCGRRGKSKSKRSKLKKQEPQPQEERYVVEMVGRHMRPGWQLRQRAKDKHQLTGIKQKKIRIIEPQAPPSLRLEKKLTKSRRRRFKWTWDYWRYVTEMRLF
jgi:hypothetical protein